MNSLSSRATVTAVRIPALLVGAVLLAGPVASPAGLAVAVACGLIAIGAVDTIAAATTAAGRWLPAAGAAGWLAPAVAVGWLAAAVLAAAWPDPTVRVLAVVAGLALVAGGVLAAAGRRWIPGAAGAALGVVLLSWPGVTVYGAAVVVGLRVVLSGIAGPPLPTRWYRLGAAALPALACLAVGIRLHATEPHPDAFYTPPASVPAAPGALLRLQSLPHGAPAGARAWRILYTTTRDDRTPAVASALVLAAAQPPPGPRPVLAWAHGATGDTPGCAPSLRPDPLGSGAMPGLDQVLAGGWVVVATDYPGLGTGGPHPFLIGQGEARAVLDAVRAARHLTTVALGDRTVVWGHSQGGNAALWTGILAPAYAPDAGVIGVAALAPGSNLPALARLWGGAGNTAIFAAYLIRAYRDAYPDVHFGTYVRATAAVQVHELADRCLDDPEVYLAGTAALLAGQPVWATDPDTGAFGARLRENTPTGPIPVPVLIAQGDSDTSVPPATQVDFVHERCDSGGRVDYRTYPGRTHVGLIAPDSPLVPELLRWTEDRLDALPSRSTCPA